MRVHSVHQYRTNVCAHYPVLVIGAGTSRVLRIGRPVMRVRYHESQGASHPCRRQLC